MWTEMINAASQIRGFVSPDRICVDTVMRASKRGEWLGEVDSGWLSVDGQRSMCEKCTGHLRYMGHAEIMERQLQGPSSVPYPNVADEMR